jgi:hypothetical protein
LPGPGAAPRGAGDRLTDLPATAAAQALDRLERGDVELVLWAPCGPFHCNHVVGAGNQHREPVEVDSIRPAPQLFVAVDARSSPLDIQPSSRGFQVQQFDALERALVGNEWHICFNVPEPGIKIDEHSA